MRKIILFFALLTWAGNSPAQKARDWYRPDTRVPYRNVNGKLIVDVEVNGHTRPFVFDTGATTTVITDIFCRELNPDTVGVTKTHDSGGQFHALPTVRLDTLKIGDWVITRNIAAVTPAGNPIFECYGISGIIGSDILQKKAVRIQSRDSVLLFADNAEKAWQLNRKEGEKVKIWGSRPFFNIRLSRGEHKASHWILIDTGAENYSCRLIGHFDYLAKQGVLDTLKKGYGRFSIGLHGTEPEGEQWAAIAGRVHIGDAVLEQVPVASTQAPVSFLGTFLLEYGDMTVDYKNKRFYYEPFSDPVSLAGRLPKRFSILWIRGECVVGTIWDEETALLISPGDRIISFGDQVPREYDYCDFITGKAKAFGPDMVMKVETQAGDIVEFTFK